MANRELARYALIAPDFLPGSLRVLGEVFVSRSEILVDETLGCFWGGEIAIVNDRTSHTAEY